MLTHSQFTGSPREQSFKLSEVSQLLDVQQLVEDRILQEVNQSYLRAISDQFEFHLISRSEMFDFGCVREVNMLTVNIDLLKLSIVFGITNSFGDLTLKFV